jgi:hypothetical protein
MFEHGIASMEKSASSEAQQLDPEASTSCLLGSEDARRFGIDCLQIALCHPQTLESLTPGTLSPK